MTADPFRLLVVCTGNVCRSPVAAALLRDALAEIAPGQVEVSSAGTRALVGEPAQPRSTVIATSLGTTLDGFRAQQLTEAMAESADLVLTMGTGHKDEVLRFSPSVLKRIFAVREFARILRALPHDPAEHAAAAGGQPRKAWQQLVARAWAAKAEGGLAGEPAGDDVVDPYRKGPEVYAQMESELVPALEAIFERAERIARG